MATISLKRFAGEIPRVPAHDLPDSNAAEAINCNFAYGELRPLKGGFELKTLANAAKSLFTLNGTSFFSWTSKTRAWKGPVIGDTFNRMYYANVSDGFRVAYTTDTKADGGPPPTSYRVGVPRPTTPLTYKLVDLTALPDYPNATVKVYSYYEADGRRYQEQEVTSLAAVKPFREYTFTVAPPALPTDSSPTANAGARRVAATSFTYDALVQQGESSWYESTTIAVNNQLIEIVDGSTVKFGAQTFERVSSITPVSGYATTPGTLLSGAEAALDSTPPTGAGLSVRVDVLDTAKNVTVFSLSASSEVASSRSDAVPGGVQAQLIKNGDSSGSWKVLLTYGVMDTRAYVATIVNIQNEESQPSDPIIASPTYMQAVELTLTAPTLTGYVPQDRCRFYRSVGTDYLSCTPTPVALSLPTTTFTDTVINITDTDAVLETQAWAMPPTDLRGLTLLPNGFFAGFTGDTLRFSEPYAPWAWPYSMTFPYRIVAIRATENALVVLTNSYPYIVSGVHPAAMTQSLLSTAQAGLSEGGICNVGSAVAYVSYDGIVMIRGGQVDVESFQKLFTREVWRARYAGSLDTMELAYHDGALIGASPTAGKCFEIRLDEAAGAYTQLSSAIRMDTAVVLPATDQLYFVNGTSLQQYRGGSDLDYSWTSKDFILPKPVNFGAGYINAQPGTVAVSIYADGELWHTMTLTVSATKTTITIGSSTTDMVPAGYFRLPGGRKALRWSVKLAGKAIVREFALAERMEELRRV